MAQSEALGSFGVSSGGFLLHPFPISRTDLSSPILLAATSGVYSSSGWVLYGFPLSPPLKGAFYDTNGSAGRRKHTEGTSQAGITP